ncbi:MAG: hypothetical protein ACI9J3_000545 [Parvicellaceae bacterium]|jgi:hypothetical protein
MKFLILLCAFFLSLVSLAQKPIDNVLLRAHWNIGETYEFEVTRIKKNWTHEDSVSIDSITYKTKLAVQDTFAGYYDLIWSFDHECFNQYSVPAGLFNKVNKSTAFDVHYTTDQIGSFVGVQNWEAIGSKLHDDFQTTITAVTRDSSNAREEVTDLMTPFLDVITTKHGIEEIYLAELQYFHFPYGARFQLGDSLKYDQDIPNFLGGTPIKGKTAVYLKSINQTNCTIISEMTLDPFQVKGLVINLLRGLNYDEDKMTKAMASSRILIEDKNHMEYDHKKGIPIYIRAERITEINLASAQNNRIDITEIRLIAK